MILPLQRNIIYGPIKSRRLGISLGINLLSPYQKICSFDCIYCQYGKTNTLTLNPELASLFDMEEINKKVELALKLQPKLDHITFSGNGEPTLHPQFAEIAKRISILRKKCVPMVRLAIFSNATTLDRKEVKAGLRYFDIVILKLDAADQSTFVKINQPCPEIFIESIIKDLKEIPNVVIQSLFIKGKISNIEGKSYQRWLEAIRAIKPKAIQIYSTDRPVPDKGVEKVFPYELIKIAEDIRSSVNITVDTFWAA